MSYEECRQLVEAAAAKYGLEPALVCAVIQVESGWQANAYNPSGATGLMQVMCKEAGFPDRPSKAELLDPQTNLDWGCKILADCLKRADGDVQKALCYYSGGTAWKSYEQYLSAYWSRIAVALERYRHEDTGIDFSSYPTPPGDTGAGYHMGANAYFPLGDNEGLYHSILEEFYRCGLRWAKILDADGASYNACRACSEMGIMPVVRLYRYRPYPGTLTSKQRDAARQLYDVGVRYFERGNEPNLSWEWASDFPGNDWNAWTPAVFDRLASDWIADAEYLASFGGYVAIDALAGGGDMDDVLYLRGFLAALQRAGATDLLRQHGWIACHPAGLNHPLTYPEDPRNQQDHPGVTILSDVPGEAPSSASNCIRKPWKVQHEFEQVFGFRLPLMATEGGFWVGNHADARYAPLSVQSASDLNYSHLTSMASAPEWYIAAMPWLWSNRLFANKHEGFERDAVKRIPGWGNCPASEPAVQPIVPMLLNNPCKERANMPTPTPEPTGQVTVAEREQARQALATVPATMKAAAERGYVWLKELYQPGDAYALAIAYSTASRRYLVLKLDATTWQVVGEATL